MPPFKFIMTSFYVRIAKKYKIKNTQKYLYFIHRYPWDLYRYKNK